jgi:hypothetical protein
MMSAAVAQTAQPDAQNSKVAGAGPNFTTWMTDYSKTNQGRISRDAYMKESGRRWDSMDQNKQGLTTDQVYTLYGYQPLTTDNTGNPMNQNNLKR